MSGNEYVSQLRAERDRLLAVVARVEGLLPLWHESYKWRNAGGPDVAAHEEHVAQALWVVMNDLRDALSAPSPSAEQLYTETDGPAPAGPYAATEGADDGV